MSAPVFTLYILMLAFNRTLEEPPLFFGASTGPLVFHSRDACESVRVEVAKRNYPAAFCVHISTTKGDAQ